MVREGVGRLPVVSRTDPGRVVGMVTRSDLVAVYAPAHRRRAPGEPRYRMPQRRASSPQAQPAAPGSEG